MTPFTGEGDTMRQSNLRLVGIGALLALGVSACDSNKLTTIIASTTGITSSRPYELIISTALKVSRRGGAI